MARPTDSAGLRTAREALVNELIAAARLARLAQEASTPERTQHVEDAFFRAAAALETFLSEWMIRCLSIDSTRFSATFRRRIEDQALTLLNRFYEPSKRLWTKKAPPTIRVTIPVTKRNTLAASLSLLGRSEDNYPMRSAGQLRADANQYLIDVFAKRAGRLTGHQHAVLDATLAIRNVLAHRTPRAVHAMNSKLRASRLPASLRRSKNNVRASALGQYLCAKSAGRPRYEEYFLELGRIAHVLVPSRGRPRKIC
jgi:hypothetical protein